MYSNYYNPMYNYGYYQGLGSQGLNSIGKIGRIGLLSKLKNGVNWNTLLNNTSRTLNIVNQTIPLVNQVKPLVGNIKTMFKIADIMKTDTPSKKVNQDINKKEVNPVYEDQPTFFL